MRKMMKRLSAGFLSLLLALSLVLPGIPVYAEAATDPVIVVSLGDSYSSGEGIEKFYGQDKSVREKVLDDDWLAHRSTKSWPSLLKVGDSQTMGNYKVALGTIFHSYLYCIDVTSKATFVSRHRITGGIFYFKSCYFNKRWYSTYFGFARGHKQSSYNT